MGVELAEKLLGPQGGDLNNPKQHPERRNSPHCSHVDEEGIIGFHDPREHDVAMMGIQKEKPWHRMAAIMLNRGFTNKEIAEMAQVQPNAVSQLRAQRWFNELCVRLATDVGEALNGRLEAEAFSSLENISTIANSDAKEVGYRTKLAANLALLEHATGKPVQKILSVNAHTSYSSAQAEMEAIQSELAEIRRAKEGTTGPKATPSPASQELAPAHSEISP